MLTSNLQVKFGLFNGSFGTVVDIIYAPSENPKTSHPLVVMVDFTKYSGPAFIAHCPRLVPITPIERKLDCPCHHCKRIQIPLRLGWGSTIHRCQGMTIGKMEPSRYIINKGTRNFESQNPGDLYVALSRARTAGNKITNEDPDFAWHPSKLVNEDRLCYKVITETTKTRKKEIGRIEELTNTTREIFASFSADPSEFPNTFTPMAYEE
ncbi:hypothetical protein FSP39_012488 [Pinctada imbricata]|uniref:DNA helicase n=1 Tax=Pinctada imbricata TaxID=66713 RepID=A0AA88Y6T2_PINIB|nr:hypothetical protein FSP39_012488 [Pinctada imbricata]